MKKRIIPFLSAMSIVLSGISVNASAVEETVKGDINNDGRFTIADVVMLEKWLLGDSNIELNNWRAADFNDDNVTDCFDYCLMKRKLCEKYGLNNTANNETASNDMPGTVHTNLKVSYDEAKKLFGYPIEKCTAENFLGYRVGVISSDGNTDSKSARCADVTYEFTNGKIGIIHQDITGGSLCSITPVQYDYKNRIFMNHSSLYIDCIDIQIGYYPTEDRGIAYYAVFNKDTDINEIMDLIISLEL